MVTVILLVGLEFLWLYISLYAVEALGVMEAEWGLLNAVLFPLNALLSSILGKIADKIRLKVSLFMGATLIYLYSLLLAFPLGIGAIYLGGLFVIDIIEEGFLWSSFFKIELELTDKETRERVFGLVTSLTGIVRAGIAPGIGIIYSMYKRAIFLIGGHLILVLSPIAFKRKERELKTKKIR